MDAWKIMAIALLASSSNSALAEPRDNPFDQALFITTIAPSILVAGTTGLTTLIPEIFKSAKSDALAFIGSNEGIRGAQFEQAVRHYHESAPAPLMNDQQLALTIVTTY
ncbi:DUF2388 domain-containing protein [Pseudomonas sichuanensis]|uniref:DUF2388 domain-containing protein n=1 Tax=Pseudomonas TaxID=286 RepID=UPI0036E4141D